MKIGSKKNTLQSNMLRLYVVADYLSAIIAWLIFWFYRQSILHNIDPNIFPAQRAFFYRDYLISLIIIPCSWLVLNLLSGTYFDLYKKSRLQEFYKTILVSLIGSSIVGLIAFANDTGEFAYFFKITSWYLFVNVSITLLFRMSILFQVKKQLKEGKVKYPTLIVGSNGTISQVYEELTHHNPQHGTELVGYINIENQALNADFPLDFLGDLSQLEKIIADQKIDTVVLAIHSNAHQLLEQIMIRMSYLGVTIKALPDLYDLISGSVRTRNILAPVLITINPQLLPDWQKVCKRAIDITVSSMAILGLSPLYIFAAIRVKLSSDGPIFYQQQRIGLHGRPFNILKFRSMFVNAEENGPLLSSDNDSRITKWGKVMRKWRIDEIPQFFNILIGDMSLVGPRPERKYFINKIIKTHPHYKLLHQVKPGLTSWGMVQYGYAENVDEMIERMKYDLLYIENCSLLMDAKIMIYTVRVILQGRGK